MFIFEVPCRPKHDEQLLNQIREQRNSLFSIRRTELALRLADAAYAISKGIEDAYMLGRILFALRQYIAVETLMQSKGYISESLACRIQFLEALMAQNKTQEAIAFSDPCLVSDEDVIPEIENAVSRYSRMWTIRGRAYLAQHNMQQARVCFMRALDCDITAYDALDLLISHNLLSPGEELNWLYAEFFLEGETELLSQKQKEKLLLGEISTDHQIQLDGAEEFLMHIYRLQFSKDNLFPGESTEIVPGTHATSMYSFNLSFRTLESYGLKDGAFIQVAKAQICISLGHYNVALEYLNGLFESFSHYSEVLHEYLWCLLKMNKKAELCSLVEMIEGAASCNSPALVKFARACFLFADGNIQHAKETFKEAATLDPSFKLACLGLFLTTKGSDEFELVIGDIEKMQMYMPRSHWPAYYQGLCGMAAKNGKFAVEGLHKAYNMCPRNPQIAFELANIYYLLGENTLAFKIFSEALHIFGENSYNIPNFRGSVYLVMAKMYLKINAVVANEYISKALKEMDDPDLQSEKHLVAGDINIVLNNNEGALTQYSLALANRSEQVALRTGRKSNLHMSWLKNK